MSALGVVRATGGFAAFSLDVLRGLRHRPFQWREFIEQAWFIATVSILPTALVAIPLGAVVALQMGTLTQQLGAQSLTGGIAVLAIIREGAPLATALLLAGAAGSAICADMGSRKVREELDAIRVLGIDPIPRLVVPRVVGCVIVSFFLTAFVAGVGIAGGYFFNVVLQNGTPGAYVASFTTLAALPDLVFAEIKGLIFGGIAGVVGAYKGVNAGGGPKGVGQAVNESVVLTFALLFLTNYLMSMIFFQLYPQAGM